MSVLSYIPTLHPGPAWYRWKGDDFDRLVEDGFFDRQRVELVNGVIVELPPMNDPHGHAVRLTNYALLEVFPPTRATVSVQCPMRLGESRPFPDLAVIAGTPRQVARHPESALLVLEVSDTTLEYDRQEKGPLYATHFIQDYWIVNLNGRCVEVHRNPIGADSGDPRYAQVQVYSETDSIAPLSAPQHLIRVADLLP